MIHNAGFDRIQLSIDSLNINVVKYLLGITDDNYLKNMIKMIEILLKNNVDIRIKAVLTAFNASGMKEFLLFWKKLGIRHIQIVQYGRTPFRHTDDLFCTNEQFKEVKQIVNEFKTLYPDFHLVDDDFCSEYRQPVAEKNHDERLFFSNRGICNAGRFSLTMLQNGEVFICENLPYKKEFVLGDLCEQSVMEYWNSDRVKQWLSPPARNIFADGIPCKTCDEKYYNRCHKTFSRCLRYCYETFNNVNTSDINCPYTQFKKYRIT